MLKELKKFCRLLSSLPQTLVKQRGLLENLLARQDTLYLTIGQMTKAIDKATKDYEALVEQQDTLRAFVSTIEAAGISRKFGSRIDVDYDKLLDNLGADGEAEMMRTIKSRRDEMRRRLKVTIPSKVPVKEPYKPIN